MSAPDDYEVFAWGDGTATARIYGSGVLRVTDSATGLDTSLELPDALYVGRLIGSILRVTGCALAYDPDYIPPISVIEIPTKGES